MNDRDERISLLHEMAAELRSIRYHIRQYNLICERLGYDDILESPDDLQSRISQEINWLEA